MTRLSVNINKIALIRNSRNANYPDLRKVAIDCEEFGAQGITVHPRPDERHVRFTDLPILKECVQTEFNIEGYPSDFFIKNVLQVKPDQCTLVPDPPGALTSSEGWDTIRHQRFLKDAVKKLQDAGIRVSLFMDPKADLIDAAKETGVDRIELYTGAFAHEHKENKKNVLEAHVQASAQCKGLGLGLNAGHDLNLENLYDYKSSVLSLLEVSIGHALVCDSLYYGLKNSIQMYLHLLSKK